MTVNLQTEKPSGDRGKQSRLITLLRRRKGQLSLSTKRTVGGRNRGPTKKKKGVDSTKFQRKKRRKYFEMSVKKQAKSHAKKGKG